MIFLGESQVSLIWDEAASPERKRWRNVREMLSET